MPISCQMVSDRLPGWLYAADPRPFLGNRFWPLAPAEALPHVSPKDHILQLLQVKLILSVDRLDYSKGIPGRVKAYEKFLQLYPSWHSKVTLIMVVVPSRATVQDYAELKVSPLSPVLHFAHFKPPHFSLS